MLQEERDEFEKELASLVIKLESSMAGQAEGEKTVKLLGAVLEKLSKELQEDRAKPYKKFDEVGENDDGNNEDDVPIE